MRWTPIADMIEAMFDNGADLKSVLLAVRTIEERDGERDASRFVMVPKDEKAAIRAKRYREKQKQNQHSAEANDAAKAGAQSVTEGRDASRYGVTERCNLPSLLSEFPRGNREVSKKETTVVVEGQKPKSTRGTRLDSCASLPESDRKFARDLGMPDHQIDHAWAEFVDYWISVPGQRGTKLNWSATWRNRARQISGRVGNATTKRSVQDASADLVGRMREFDRPAPSGLRGGEGAAVVRLLSKG